MISKPLGRKKKERVSGTQFSSLERVATIDKGKYVFVDALQRIWKIERLDWMDKHAERWRGECIDGDPSINAFRKGTKNSVMTDIRILAIQDARRYKEVALGLKGR